MACQFFDSFSHLNLVFDGMSKIWFFLQVKSPTLVVKFLFIDNFIPGISDVVQSSLKRARQGRGRSCSHLGD